MSKRKPLQAEDSGKWETIRRLRYGDLLKRFRHRWGTELPNDDAGRDDLWLLVTCVSLAAAEPKKKMRHVIEMWAPWMSADEREAYVEHVWGLDIYERTLTGRGSPEPRIDPATENDPRIAALKNWGRAAQRFAGKTGKHDA